MFLNSYKPVLQHVLLFHLSCFPSKYFRVALALNKCSTSGLGKINMQNAKLQLKTRSSVKRSEFAFSALESGNISIFDHEYLISWAFKVPVSFSQEDDSFCFALLLFRKSSTFLINFFLMKNSLRTSLSRKQTTSRGSFGEWESNFIEFFALKVELTSCKLPDALIKLHFL